MGQTREPDVMIWMPSPSPLILRLLFFNPSVGAIGHRSHAAWGVLEADLSRMRVTPADPPDAPPSRTETVDKSRVFRDAPGGLSGSGVPCFETAPRELAGT